MASAEMGWGGLLDSSDLERRHILRDLLSLPRGCGKACRTAPA